MTLVKRVLPFFLAWASLLTIEGIWGRIAAVAFCAGFLICALIVFYEAVSKKKAALTPIEGTTP